MGNKVVPIRPEPTIEKGQLRRITFRTKRLAEFCSEKELTAQTGHPPSEWPLVIVKELVDNALDACEEDGIAPVITVTVDDDGIEVTDNGPGLPAQTIRDILDYNFRVSSREAYVSPTRGAQGNALKCILAMPYVLDGKRGLVEIEAKGVRHVIGFTFDDIRQEPAISHDPEPTDRTIGTLVRVRWPVDSPRSKLADAKPRFLQIADNFTWLNPHLTLTTHWFGEENIVEATNPTWDKWKPRHPTSPHWYGPKELGRLIAAYLTHEQDTGQQRTVREFVTEFRGLTGSAKQMTVLDATGLSREPLSRLASGGSLDEAMISRLLQTMQINSNPVKPALLGIIGEEHLRTRFEAAGCEMESFQYRKVVLDYNDLPTVVEVAFGWVDDVENEDEDEDEVEDEDDYSGEEDEDDEDDVVRRRRLVTGVNWSAGIINPFRQLGWRSLDDILTQQRASPDQSVIVVLHMARPLAQYTDRGKSAVVVGGGVITSKIISAVEAVTKTWAKQMRREERDAEAVANRRRVMTRSNARTFLNKAAAEVMKEAYLKASDNGQLPALARQIMYAARPFIQERTGENLDDKYFTKTLLPEYMAANAKECAGWNVAYDARGHFHEPHTDHEVPLGTIDVLNYLRDVAKHAVGDPRFDVREKLYPTLGPVNRYGNILFIEKEGFLPLFEAVQLGDRFDIAIMSTKGTSVTAARKLVDVICSCHAIRLLVLHDFDKSGFSIVGTLKRDTQRYTFENEIEVVDLGMRIDDIVGLQTESSNIKAKSREAARLNLRKNGATPEEIEFLLEQRVELNAFTSNELVAWVEKKLVEHGVKKVIPNDETLTAAYRRASEHEAVQRMIDKAVPALRKSLAGVTPPTDLRSLIEKQLTADPTRTWDSVVMEIVAKTKERR